MIRTLACSSSRSPVFSVTPSTFLRDMCSRTRRLFSTSGPSNAPVTSAEELQENGLVSTGSPSNILEITCIHKPFLRSCALPSKRCFANGIFITRFCGVLASCVIHLKTKNHKHHNVTTSLFKRFTIIENAYNLDLVAEMNSEAARLAAAQAVETAERQQ